MEWLEPWIPIDDGGLALVAELKKELASEYALLGLGITRAVARRTDVDDVLYQLADSSFMVVHLTWTGKADLSPDYPGTTRYQSLDDFSVHVMFPAAREYGTIG